MVGSVCVRKGWCEGWRSGGRGSKREQIYVWTVQTKFNETEGRKKSATSGHWLFTFYSVFPWGFCAPRREALLFLTCLSELVFAFATLAFSI